MGLKAKNKKGEYFRNNVWWWRRLWRFVCLNCSDILTKNEQKNGEYNNCKEISEEKALKIAIRLKEKIKDETVSNYLKEVNKLIKEAKKENKEYNKIKSKKHNWEEDYQFTITNLKEFITFVENSGGFEIC